MAAKNAVATYKPHALVVDERVKLGRIDRGQIDRWAGFQTHPKSTVETRLSDNLLKAVLYVFRGIGIQQKRAEDRGFKVEAPTADKVIELIMSDRLVRQRMREIVAQANLAGMTALPVKLPNNSEEPACMFMQYVLSNLSKGFDTGNMPEHIPVLEPRFVGAAPASEAGPVEDEATANED